VATPILTGSLVRLPLGILTDRYGGRIVFFIQMLLVSIPTWLVSYATEYWQYLVLGLFVGLAGGSFAVGIAYTSTWFSKERQGTAMGIFGAGNAGSSLTKFVAPMIIAAFGAWQMVPKVYAVAMIVMAILFWFFTYTDPLHQKDARTKPRPTEPGPAVACRCSTRGSGASGWPYAFVFGGFVALALVAAQVLRRRIRPAAGNRRVSHHLFRPAFRGDPRPGWLGVGQVGRQRRHLVGAVDQPGLPVPAQLSADHHGHSRHQGRCLGQSRHRRSCCSPSWRSWSAWPRASARPASIAAWPTTIRPRWAWSAASSA
jgi:MYXO-CTERM domain-containing protein